MAVVLSFGWFGTHFLTTANSVPYSFVLCQYGEQKYFSPLKSALRPCKHWAKSTFRRFARKIFFMNFQQVRRNCGTIRTMKTKPVVILLLSVLACAALRAAPICDFMGCKFGSQSPSVAGITNALGSAYGEWRVKTAGMPPHEKEIWWSAQKIANTGEVFSVQIFTTPSNRLCGVWLEWEYPEHDNITRSLIESDAAGIASDLSAQYGIELSRFNAQDGTTIANYYLCEETNDVRIIGSMDAERWSLKLHIHRRDIEAADRK